MQDTSVSCSAGRRHSSDLATLWLWLRPAAAAPVPTPGLGTSRCLRCGHERKEEWNEGRKEGRREDRVIEVSSNWQNQEVSSHLCLNGHRKRVIPHLTAITTRKRLPYGQVEDDSHNEPGAWVILSLAPERTGDVKEEPAKESDSEDGHSHFQKLHLRAERKQGRNTQNCCLSHLPVSCLEMTEPQTIHKTDVSGP